MHHHSYYFRRAYSRKEKSIKEIRRKYIYIDIDLEGVLSKIFTVKASAIGIFQRTNEGCFIDFTKRDESDLGVRNAHLSNKVIKLADFISSDDLEKGKTPKTYWQTIFPEINFK